MQKTMLKMLVLFAAVSFALSLGAQDVASITGVVSDATGAVIPNVTVLLENPSTSLEYRAVTNSEGAYTIANVQPGPGYKITFGGTGFKSVAITGLYLNVDATRTQNARLEVGGAAQTVEVSAATENVTLDSTDATVGNSFEVQLLNELPVANRDSPAALFTLQPGTTMDGAVTGARIDQDNVTLDGLDVNDNETGNAFAIVGNAPVDSVQEFRGVTAGQLSSAGEGGGGQYSLVTRSGTNQFHGSVVEYHRDTDLEANSWFNNNAGVGRPPLIRNQYGGNIGGPIKHDRAFFFFDWNSRRDTLANLVERTVPMDSLRNGSVSYMNNAGGVSTLSSAQLAAMDPQGIGFNSALETVITGRYPEPNDLSGNVGDLVNTAGFRFNAPFPLTENDYVGRADFNLTQTQKLWAKVGFAKENSTQKANQFPGDPETFPFLDNSYTYAIGHTWTIGSNKVNQAEYGETYEDYSFPNTYNATGITQWTNSFGGNGTGGTILSGPYASAVNAQARTYPVPLVRDDFTWQKGNHSLSLGGTFKWISPKGKTILDYNSPLIGIGGNIQNLATAPPAPSLRPSDLDSSSVAESRYDDAFAFALGRIASVGSTFNYNASGALVPQGTGSVADYRFYETEVYFGDTWKVTPTLNISYGVRWQNYTVPYEIHGIESLPNLDFNQYVGDRLAQSKAGQSGASALPFVSYSLGGKANHAPGYFSPVYKNFAPRLAFAWSPGADRKTVFNGGAGVVFDHTVVSSIQYQMAQFSYLFQASATQPYGTSGDPYGSLATDPRFGGFSNPPPAPTAPAALTVPYTPFVSGGSPLGLANGQAFNEGVDKTLKTPYSIGYTFGFQHEFPAGMLLRTTYVGRLGRRLLAQADANQLVDFPDTASGQMMGTAFANMELQVRAGATGAAITPQPWFEDILPAGVGQGFGFANNTDLVAEGLAPLPFRGDFADTIQALAQSRLLPANVGMGSQFSEFTYYTNKGFSSYNGLLATLHKNAGHGLQFDLNYTFSHSIDNTSLIANQIAYGGYGFLCDVVRPRECRGNSDFDVTNYFNGTFLWELPVGRGKAVASSAPFWANEFIGGWEVSGLPTYHTGNAYFALANAFVAGYANDAPAILTGSPSLLKARVNGGNGGTVFAYQDPNAALNAYTGPVGFQIGARNNLRGPGYFDLDLGLGKTFPIWEDRVNLKFRADAFNSLNHPSFDTPGTPNADNFDNADITEVNGVFGAITGTSSTARVLQVSLRLEF